MTLHKVLPFVRPTGQSAVAPDTSAYPRFAKEFGRAPAVASPVIVSATTIRQDTARTPH